jgi:hypothetical protein
MSASAMALLSKMGSAQIPPKQNRLVWGTHNRVRLPQIDAEELVERAAYPMVCTCSGVIL